MRPRKSGSRTISRSEPVAQPVGDHPRDLVFAILPFAVYAFLQSKLVDLGYITMAKALALAFVDGFSERLVVKVVESVTGGDEPAK